MGKIFEANELKTPVLCSQYLYDLSLDDLSEAECLSEDEQNTY
jgi:hypothetical protein